MKNTIKIAGISTLLLSAWGTQLEATPLYYTVSGDISAYGIHDNAGIMQEMGLSVGDNVSYTLLIDPYDGDHPHPWEGFSTNHFRVELVSGSVFGVRDITPANPDAPWGGSGVTQVTNATNQHYEGEAFYGENQISGYAPDGAVRIESYYDYFETGRLEQLLPGDSIGGYNTIWLYGEDGSYSTFQQSGVYIESVSQEAPTSSVPEPGVLWLFSLGLLGIGTSRLRKKQSATVDHLVFRDGEVTV
jgi:hypothetical protein